MTSYVEIIKNYNSIIIIIIIMIVEKVGHGVILKSFLWLTWNVYVECAVTEVVEN